MMLIANELVLPLLFVSKATDCDRFVVGTIAVVPAITMHHQ